MTTTPTVGFDPTLGPSDSPTPSAQAMYACRAWWPYSPMMREKMALVLDHFAAQRVKTAHTATAPAWRDLNVALQIIRDAVEELGPVAACSVSRDQFEPRPIDDAEAVISGILKIKDSAERDGQMKALEAAAAVADNYSREGDNAEAIIAADEIAARIRALG